MSQHNPVSYDKTKNEELKLKKKPCAGCTGCSGNCGCTIHKKEKQQSK